MFAGCAYRQRTGACCCDNPPIGCVRDAPPRPVGISFPSDVNSYAALRSTYAAPPPARPSPPPREVTPRGPQPLPLRVGRLPPLGWQGTDSLAPGLLCYADGEAAESAAASTGSQAVACVVASAAGLDGCRQRLGRAPDAVVLRCGESWAAQWAALHAAAPPNCLPGLVAPDVAFALDALRRLSASGGPVPSLLTVPLSPTSPQAHRALVGLCRRTGVLLMALHPLGDAALRSHPAVVAVGCKRAGGVDEALLAWCIGKGALPVVDNDDRGAQLAQLLAALLEAGHIMDLDAEDKAALDGLASG